jgi:hypothetical protein
LDNITSEEPPQNINEFDNNISHHRSGGNLDMIPELKDDDMNLNIIEVPQ